MVTPAEAAAPTAAKPVEAPPVRRSLRGLVLVAAWSTFGRKRFTLEALAVACWQLWPDVFAMRGYREHPDASKVYAKVYGKAARKMGRFAKHGLRRFSVTEHGEELARSLSSLLPKAGA